MIKLDKITKIYESNGIKQTALDEVSLVLPDKGFVVIYGASGCGKTTLLNILGGLDHLTSGKLIVNGRDTSSFSSSDWDSYRNQEVGFIFQQYYLLPHLNVSDNIAITLQMGGQTHNIQDKINAALDEVGILNLAKRFPKTMSGGQQQRVAIARALVANPSVVLADEPTGALDEKNAIIVMKTLKKVSKLHLVVMVTHNEKLANQYADRLIEISYGKIANDTLNEDGELTHEAKELSRVHLPLLTSLKWSIRNVIKKKSRTIPITVAMAIGLAAVGVVLSMTVGLANYTKKAQAASLTDYPVFITSYSKNSSAGHEEELEEYPDIQEVLIEKSDYYQTEHYNSMQKDFMDYMAKMPEKYYTLKDSNSAISFNIITKQGNNHIKISSTSNFARIAPTFENYKFIGEEYEVLAGHFPETINDCVLVIDTFNRVDYAILNRLGFEVEGEKITFDEVLSKEYHVISNNDMYLKEVNDKTGFDRYVMKGSSSYEELYDNSQLVLKVSGIIRQRENKTSGLFSTGILYSPLVTDYIKAQALDSDIVKKQLEYKEIYDASIPDEPGEEEVEFNVVDVLTGSYFQDVISGSYQFSANYQYEARLFDLGMEERITSLFFYTSTFEDRIRIVDYFNSYHQSKDSPLVLRSRDYLQQVTSSFSSLVNTFSTIILVFALVSIFIAAILTAILTYISVLERRKEIGLLRSLGARRIDISTMFLSESFIIGVIAAIVACALIAALLPLAGRIVVNLVRTYGYDSIQPKVSDIASFQFWVFPAAFVSGVLLSTLSASIPAAIAGKKKPADSLRE